MIESKNYSEGSAIYALARFCEAIKKKDWISALDFSTYAFQKNTARPIDHLKDYHGSHKITDITLLTFENLSDIVCQATIILNAKKTNGEFTYDIELTLIKQDRKRCLAHEAGDWGVNPDSRKILGIIENKPKKEETKKTTVKKRKTRKTK